MTTYIVYVILYMGQTTLRRGIYMERCRDWRRRIREWAF